MRSIKHGTDHYRLTWIQDWPNVHLHFFRTLVDVANSTRIGAIERVARFGKNSSGNIAVLFAVCLVPVLVAVGCAVDYSVANNQRTKMQSALDAAILAGSVAGKADTRFRRQEHRGDCGSQAAAANFFAGNTPAGVTASISTTFAMNGLTLSGKGTASGNVTNSFLKVVGQPTTELSIASQANSTAQPYLNVYLLIDISASMLLPSTSDGIDADDEGPGRLRAGLS